MDWSHIFEFIGKLVTGGAAIVGVFWALLKWKKQDELFPRINFEVSANFLGFQDDKVITELVAVLENKGQVPLKISDFSFKLRGLRVSDRLEKGPDAIRGQLLFPAVLEQGDFVPRSWNYSFVYPGVRTEYNFVMAIPSDVAFVRMEAAFVYLGRANDSHHAAKILAVPSKDTDGPQSLEPKGR